MQPPDRQADRPTVDCLLAVAGFVLVVGVLSLVPGILSVVAAFAGMR
jgi:hypothetical protein